MKKTEVIFLVFILLFINGVTSQAQNIIESKKGYSPQIGVIISMLEDLKSRIVQSVENLDEQGVDYLLDEKANRIGAMLFHLAATEKVYQLSTFENRSFNKEESEKWLLPLELGDLARQKIVDKPVDYYLNIWNEVRKETLKLLKTKDDKWLNSKVKSSSMNNHWAWYHVMEHQANHMGQIRLIIKRVPN